MRRLFTQSIDTALEPAIGEYGASDESLAHWRAQWPAAWAALQERFAPEIQAIFDLPTREEDLAQIESIGREITARYEALVVIGMGGSSLGAEVLAALSTADRPVLHVLDNIDPRTFADVTRALPWNRTAFLLVSKSGGTIELHALLGALMEEGRAQAIDITKQCYAITIPNENPLHQFARAHAIPVIAHDAALCGRFSIFSAVGLIPAAAMGVDVRAIRAGARTALVTQEVAAEAAALNMALMDQGVATHVLMHYDDRLGALGRWVRQCWAESLGKEGLGSLPVASRGVTDQHSQLQLYLDGPADKYFTSLLLDHSGQGPAIGAAFSYLNGKHLGDLLTAAQRATHDTLISEGCPLRILTLNALDAETFGALLMHFTLETIFTAALMGINPFDQPAVEAGKKRALEYLARRA